MLYNKFYFIKARGRSPAGILCFQAGIHASLSRCEHIILRATKVHAPWSCIRACLSLFTLSCWPLLTTIAINRSATYSLQSRGSRSVQYYFCFSSRYLDYCFLTHFNPERGKPTHPVMMIMMMTFFAISERQNWFSNEGCKSQWKMRLPKNQNFIAVVRRITGS